MIENKNNLSKIFLLFLISFHLNANEINTNDLNISEVQSTDLNVSVIEEKELTQKDLFENIKSFIGEEEYQRHTFLIKKLFLDKESFYENEHLKYKEIFEVLDKNGLLHLKFKRPKDIVIEFESISSSIQTIKMIKDVLMVLGYSYYFTNFLDKKDERLIWQIKLKSESMLNPSVLITKLENLNVSFVDVKKINDFKWKYEINLNNAMIADTIMIEKNEKLIVKKPHKPYLFEVKKINKLRVVSRILNKWYPNIAFYDKNLELLGSINEQKVFKTLNSNVPKNTRYISVGDTFTLLNIKRGLTVIVK